MGLLDRLSGWTKILGYEVAFGADRRVAVSTTVHDPRVQGRDYVRLWAAYHARITHDLGFPQRTSALLGLWLVSDVCVEAIDGDTDCFARADVADVVRYEPAGGLSGMCLPGALFGRGAMERAVKARFPPGATDQQLVYSSLAIMQHAIRVNASDPETLDILRGTGHHLVALYGERGGAGRRSTVEYPTRAYRAAIGAA